MEAELNKMERNYIISVDSESKYNNPLIIVRNDNTIGLVNNFILLNKKTVKEKYDMANANEIKIIIRVAGGKINFQIGFCHHFLPN